jgi:hypothetical protein
MTSNNIKQVRDAFSRLTKAKVTEYPTEKTILLETDYTLISGGKIGFYAYMHGKSKKIFFTDAGRVFKQLQSTGQQIQEAVIQAMVESYGLILMPDNTCLEQADAPLHERISNIIQLQIGIDAMIRSWNCYANKVKTRKASHENVQDS